MKKNIIYIHGDNSFLVEREKSGFVKIFKQKYTTDSIEYFSLDNTEKYGEYLNSITSVSMFYEKRMFVFSGWKNEKISKKDEKNIIDFVDLLEKNIDKIWENDFLLFYNLWKTEEKLKKFLLKIADCREKKFSYLSSEWEKYTNLSTSVIKKVLTIYEQNEKLRDRWTENKLLSSNIFQTMNNLAILERENIKINDEIIEDFCYNFEWANNFLFIDAILNEDLEKSHKILKRITKTLNYKNIDIFIGWIIWILRKNLYILRLKQLWLNTTEITKILEWTSDFIIKKAYNSKISTTKLAKIYQKIINSNIAYKSGKWMKDTILWRIFEINKVLLELKK